MTDLTKVLQVAQEAAREAGAIIREALQSNTGGTANIQIKSNNATDLVTETDQKAEELITAILKREFPSHCIIGEESSGELAQYELTEAPTWTIDPIDGTTNFVHQLKLSCVILSFLEKKEVLVAVIYDPYADELFHAIKGQGAFLQTTTSSSTDTPMQASTIAKSLSQSVVTMDPGYGRGAAHVDRYCSLQATLLKQGVNNMRTIGSTGLVMAYVACGRLDAAFEEGSWESKLGPKIWDFAAGKLLVEEAGGVTRDLEEVNATALATSTKPLDVTKRSFFCAATPELATELLALIAQGR